MLFISYIHLECSLLHTHTHTHTQHFCHLLIKKVANNIQESLHSNAYYQDNITESEKSQSQQNWSGAVLFWDCPKNQHGHLLLSTELVVNQWNKRGNIA